MTWLTARGDDVPSALVARVNASVRNHAAAAPADALIAAAEERLAHVLRDQPMTRAHALDLLTADALATYAFEAAADDPETLGARADAAVRRFARGPEARGLGREETP